VGNKICFSIIETQAKNKARNSTRWEQKKRALKLPERERRSVAVGVIRLKKQTCRGVISRATFEMRETTGATQLTVPADCRPALL
jgi:hypothetical protein